MKDIVYDLYRFTGKTDRKTYINEFFSNRAFRRLVYYRSYQNAGPLKRKWVKFWNHFLVNKMSIDLPMSVKIGKGVLMLHPYSIVFNSKCRVGDNCTIMKGVTIGNSQTGRVGSPIIGNNVYMGLNSSIVGGVRIGNNVLIAANAFVNFDVPDNSIVLGNPGVIHHKNNASIPYTNHSILELKSEGS